MKDDTSRRGLIDFMGDTKTVCHYNLMLTTFTDIEMMKICIIRTCLLYVGYMRTRFQKVLEQ